MTTKRFSLSTTSKDVKVMKECGELEMEEVSGYVICIHNNQWWLGCVLKKDLENVQVKLSLLHPSGPSQSFRYRRTPEIVTVPLFRVVLLVEPSSPTLQKKQIEIYFTIIPSSIIPSLIKMPKMIL